MGAYLPPWGASKVLVIDPTRNTSYPLPEDYGLLSGKYSSSAVAHDGRIFAAPGDASKVLVIDPSRNTSYFLPEDYSTGSTKYQDERGCPRRPDLCPASWWRVQGAGD